MKLWKKEINKSWRANLQHTGDRQQYSIIKFRIAKRLDLYCSHHKIKEVKLTLGEVIEGLAIAKWIVIL